jgi:hypothetical protein
MENLLSNDKSPTNFSAKSSALSLVLIVSVAFCITMFVTSICILSYIELVTYIPEPALPNLVSYSKIDKSKMNEPPIIYEEDGVKKAKYIFILNHKSPIYTEMKLDDEHIFYIPLFPYFGNRKINNEYLLPLYNFDYFYDQQNAYISYDTGAPFHPWLIEDVMRMSSNHKLNGFALAKFDILDIYESEADVVAVFNIEIRYNMKIVDNTPVDKNPRRPMFLRGYNQYTMFVKGVDEIVIDDSLRI